MRHASKSNDDELIKARKGNKEEKRQQLRKGVESSSRLLDNYYNSKLHSHYWRPNGKIAQMHSNSESGFSLGNDYNKASLHNNNERELKKQIHFLEFDFIEDNEALVIIEHCSHCNEHQSHTQHINNIYQSIAKLLQRCIQLRFPFIKVYLKPLGSQINKSKAKIDDSNRDVRIGAFEIQYAQKINDSVDISLIHSKLNTGLWPNFSKVLQKISNIVPLINIRCSSYDKEEGLNEENNKQIDEFLPSKFESLKVNLYLLVNEQIEAYSQQAMDELSIILNPKRRQVALNEQCQQKEDQMDEGMKGNYSMLTTLTNNLSNKNSIVSRPTTSRVSRFHSNSIRPITGKSSYSQNSFNQSMTSLQGRPASSSSSHYSTFRGKLNVLKTLDDAHTINRLKGKLLSSGLTDKNGCLTFNNVPYDSYVIEIEPCKHFLISAALTRFNKIIPAVKGSDSLTVSKFFGLRRQIDSYVEVYIYSNESNNELDLNLINKASVFLRRSYECEASLFPPGEHKLQLIESQTVKGRYEIITSPGKIILEIHKERYEPIKREITLRTGENKINIELVNSL